MTANKLKNCPDCKVEPGEVHLDLCDVERCSVCGWQRISCDCVGHDKQFAKWTGIRPLEAEVEYLGMDLNEIYSSGIYKHFVIKAVEK